MTTRSEPAATPAGSRLDDRWPLVLFLAALVAHAVLVTANWRGRFLPGHEFRQTLTATIARHIDAEDHFGLDYPNPILGKPWSVPLEFPLYEWSVVGLARLTGWPHVEAARAVSVACFYLMLPALYGLLGQAGLPPRRRLIALALVPCCGVYIYYSRAFLMDSMATMFSAWFLTLFVAAMRAPRAGPALLAGLCGAAAGLIKVPILSVWMLPAAAYGAWRLWRALRDEPGRGAAGRVLGWGLVCALMAGGPALWWIKTTDAVKAVHPAAGFLTSDALAAGSFGFFDLATRLSPETWRLFAERWREAILPAWALLAVAGAGALLLPRERPRVLGAAGMFLAAVLMYPTAFAYHDYYFFGCGVFALAALGFVVAGLDDAGARLRRLALVATVVLGAALLANYQRNYRGIQVMPSHGGSGLTDMLRDMTPPDAVLIVAGNDWAPIIPYYAQRRALMLRHGSEHDTAYVERTFRSLEDENVFAMVLVGEQRQNQSLRRMASAWFDLDTRPGLRHRNADVYVSRTFEGNLLDRLRRSNTYSELELPEKPPAASEPEAIRPALARRAYAMISPLPIARRFQFDYSVFHDEAGRELLSVHPEADLWVPVPGGAREITWEFGLLPSSYAEVSMADGVDFIVMGEAKDGARREIARWFINPTHVPEHRGPQRVRVPYDPVPGETLVFQTRPHGNSVYDWAYFARIQVH